MKKIIILIITLFFFNVNSMAQNIQEYGNIVIVVDRYEPIYKNVGYNNNGDYGEGTYEIYAKLYWELYKDNSQKPKLLLAVVQYSLNKRKKNFTKIGFKFENNKSTGLINYSSKKYLSCVQSNEYIFDVTNYLKLIQLQNIDKILFNGYSGSFNLTPTDKYLLRRQFETISKLGKK